MFLILCGLFNLTDFYLGEMFSGFFLLILKNPLIYNSVINLNRVKNKEYTMNYILMMDPKQPKTAEHEHNCSS